MPDYRNRPPVDEPTVIELNWRAIGATGAWMAIGAFGYAVAVVLGLAWR